MCKIYIKEERWKVLIIAKYNISKAGILWIIFEVVRIYMENGLSNFLYFIFVLNNELVIGVFLAMLSYETDDKKGFNLTFSFLRAMWGSISLNNKITSSFNSNWLVIKQYNKSFISNKSTFKFGLCYYFKVLISFSY